MATHKLLFVRDLDRACDEISRSNGRVLHIFNTHLIEALFRDDFLFATLHHSQPTPYAPPDAPTQLFVDAWHHRQTAVKRPEKRHKVDGLPWDYPGYLAPRNPRNDPELAKDAKQILAPNSAYMIGSVAVGVWIIQGPSSSGMDFSSSEVRNVHEAVYIGLRLWGSADLRNDILFRYDLHQISLEASPNAGCKTYEVCESVFRDPALQKMGYPAGKSGIDQYVTALRSQSRTDWAYMAFFVKYPLGHYAYNSSTTNSRYVCMQYSNDGWGPSRLGNVFAHETGHSFGALDEYASACTCAESSGQCGVPNNNCRNCSGDHQDCIMDAKTMLICQWSAGQVGWRYVSPGYETSLPGTGSNIVSVLPSGGNLFAGSDGRCFKLDSAGLIVHTNDLSSRGHHEVRLTVSDDGSTLYLGTDGYALALSTSDLSTSWQTSLPHTGSNIVSVLFNGGYLFAASNGYVFKLDEDLSIQHTNTLSGLGNHEVRLAISDDGSVLFVGTNGYALGLNSSDLSTAWGKTTSLPHTGSNVVSVLYSNGSVYTGSNGYVYQLNASTGDIMNSNGLPDRGNHEVRFALSADGETLFVGTDGYALALNATTLDTKWQTSLPKTGSNIVSLQVLDDYLFAGSNGYLYGLEMEYGTIIHSDGLPCRGNHQLRLAAADSVLYLGTDGYALSRNANGPAPDCGQETRPRSIATLRVNINTASARVLELLPEVGPKLAERIVEHRAKQPFESIEDIIEVRGIGPKTLGAMAPYLIARGESQEVDSAGI